MSAPAVKQIEVPPIPGSFATLGQQLAFLLLLAAVLSGPFVLRMLGRPARVAVYDAMPINAGNYRFIADQIFRESGDIDVLFLGSSPLWAGIDTPQAQRYLSKIAQHSATVLSFGTNYEAPDILYYQLQDLLAHRKVRLLVLQTPIGAAFSDDEPGRYLYSFMPNGPAPVARDLRIRLADYAGQVLATPRRFLAIFRASVPEPKDNNLGALLAERGFFGRPPVTFRPRQTPTAVFPAFDYRQHGSLRPYHLSYIRAIVALAHRHGTAVTLLNFPLYRERSSTVILERQRWSSVLGQDVPLIGIAPAKLFSGLTQAEISLLYYDELHFNKNGATFFTRAVLPAISSAYEQALSNQQ